MRSRSGTTSGVRALAAGLYGVAAVDGRRRQGEDEDEGAVGGHDDRQRADATKARTADTTISRVRS